MSGPLISSINSGQFFYFVFVFFLPGTIIWYFRSHFVIGRPEKFSEHLLIFIVFSSIYALLLGLPLTWLLAKIENPWLNYLIWFVYIVVLPMVVGVLVGVSTQRRGLTRLFLALRLPAKTKFISGWEWLFGQLERPVYLLITFKDGSKIYGYFGEKSLASSDPSERDIFLEEVWDFDAESQRWKPLAEQRGILIMSAEVRHIEVWNFPATQRPSDGQEDSAEIALASRETSNRQDSD